MSLNCNPGDEDTCIGGKDCISPDCGGARPPVTVRTKADEEADRIAKANLARCGNIAPHVGHVIERMQIHETADVGKICFGVPDLDASKLVVLPEPEPVKKFRVIRLLTYTYDSAERMERDMARWAVPANGSGPRLSTTVVIRSATLPFEIITGEDV